MLHSYCNAVKNTGTRSLFLVAGTQRSPICTMRCRPSDANLLMEDLATTSFVGRERELREVEGLLGRTRLLTLTGVEGSGKTRLALRVAGDLRTSFGDGTRWVDLASLAGPDLVQRKVASTLGVAESAGRPTSGLLVEYLESRDVLLILDNCEHLVGACASLADILLRACPDVRMLATSRLASPGRSRGPSRRSRCPTRGTGRLREGYSVVRRSGSSSSGPGPSHP